MHGSERREQIIRQIQESKAPVSGTKLASLYSVSRQVIVQDIALIRAAGYEIISTNRGYILNQPKTVCRIFKVQHTDEQLEEELNTIVDLGGCRQCHDPSQSLWKDGGGTGLKFPEKGRSIYGRYPKWQVQSA